MENSFRPLLPARRPDEADRPTSVLGTPSSHWKRKRIQTAAACLSCQRNKTKCNGIRPVCGRCTSKRLDCKWEFDTRGVTRYAGLKAKNIQLEHDRTKHLRLLAEIQSAPPDEVHKLLASMRSDTVLAQAIKDMRSEARAEPHDDTERECVRGTQSSAIEEAAESPSIADVVANPASDDLVSGPKTIQDRQKAALVDGSAAFVRCTGSLFFVYTKEEISEMRQSALQHLASKSPNDDLDQPSNPNLTIYLAEISVISAVGLQYIKDPVSAQEAARSHVDRTYDLAAALYKSAKTYLDEVIAHNPLRAMKFCAVLSMYNIITHSTVAVAYAEMGIKLGENHGIHKGLQTLGLSRNELANYRRVLRTLITLRSWLASTLGYTPTNQQSVKLCNLINVQTEDVQVEDIIQQRMAMITIIKSRFLYTIGGLTTPSPTLLRDVRDELSQWYQELPRWMQLKSLAEESSELSVEQQRVVFFVHLFYLSAIILKSRVVHGVRGIDKFTYDSTEMRTAVAEGVEASRSSSRLLKLLLTQQAIFEKCWLCIFSSYMSGMTLLYAVARRLQAKCSPEIWSTDYALVGYCLQVLKFCSTEDTIARSFHATLKQELDEIVQCIRQLDIEPMLDEPKAVSNVIDPSPEYLYTPIQASSFLGETSLRLVRILQQPFETFDRRPMAKTMTSIEEISVGVHVDWAFEIGATPYSERAPCRRPCQDGSCLIPARNGVNWGWSQH